MGNLVVPATREAGWAPEPIWTLRRKKYLVQYGLVDLQFLTKRYGDVATSPYRCILNCKFTNPSYKRPQFSRQPEWFVFRSEYWKYCWNNCILNEIASGAYTVFWHRVWCSRPSVLLWSAGYPFLRERGSCLLLFKVRTQVIYQLTICCLKMSINISYAWSQYTKCSHFERFLHPY
jgi:hypothetical protein